MTLATTALALGSIAAAALGTALWATAGSRHERAGIALSAEQLDFGTLPQQQVFEAALGLRNTGDRALTLQRVSADCGCVRADLPSAGVVLAPGEVHTLTVHLHTHDLSGAIAREIIIHSDDPARPLVPVAIRARVGRGLVLSPAQANFGRTAPGSPAVARIFLTAFDSAAGPVIQEAASAGASGVRYTFAQRTEGATTVLTLTHPGMAVPGSHTDTISIRTSAADRPVVQVRSLLVVAQPLFCEPSEVVVAVLRPGERRTVRVRVQTARPAASVEVSARYVPAAAPGAALRGSATALRTQGSAWAVDLDLRPSVRARPLWPGRLAASPSRPRPPGSDGPSTCR